MSTPGTVLVTGASSGLGPVLAGELLDRGWEVVAVARSEPPAKLEGHKRCTIVRADLAKDACEATIREALAKWGKPLDLLINNAGQPGRARHLDEVTPTELAGMWEVHVLGVVRVTKAALPALRKAKQPTVINVSSRLGSMARNAGGAFAAVPTSYAYRIAKGAANMLSLCMINDSKLAGIKFLIVHPGRIKTANAAVDADLTPEQAAHRFADFVENRDKYPSGTYCETDGSPLPW